MIKISKVRYPELNSIMRLEPNPHILFGHEIFWEEKRDGSNLGIWLDDYGTLRVRSRNMDKASDQFYDIFINTAEAAKISELLLSMRADWRDECVIFGELLIHGQSPTRTELHEKDEFIVFDMWSSKVGGLIPYMLVYQHCYHFHIPIVELYGSSQHVTLDSLLLFRDKMLTIAKERGKEGVVGKTFDKNTKYQYFKEKLDTPKLNKIPRKIEESELILPPLSESEVLGALDKVLVDLGTEQFKDKTIAMPLFAKYINIECAKHNSAKPNRALFKYYSTKITDNEFLKYLPEVRKHET